MFIFEGGWISPQENGAGRKFAHDTLLEISSIQKINRVYNIHVNKFSLAIISTNQLKQKKQVYFAYNVCLQSLESHFLKCTSTEMCAGMSGI